MPFGSNTLDFCIVVNCRGNISQNVKSISQRRRLKEKNTEAGLSFSPLLLSLFSLIEEEIIDY